MAIAINIRADNISAREVERLWDQVAAFEDEPSMRALGHPPHLTFAIYDSPEVDQETVREAMQGAAVGETQLRIKFRRIRWFEGPSLILWAEPETHVALARFHASISGAIDPIYCRPFYRPGAWTPHCTLGVAADGRKTDAIAFARSFDRSFEVLFDAVDCAVFPRFG
jgi:2'-5' RNA ligase